MDDENRTELRFVNEYMLANQHRRRISAFPDLIATFDENGDPLSSAKVATGSRISVLTAPASVLPLAATMHMHKLYEPLERMLDVDFAPRARARLR